jgi:hypothetical protein
MIKEIYLVRGSGTVSRPGFEKQILELSGTVLHEVDPAGMKVVFTRDAPPAVSVIPFRRSLIASVSIYQERVQPVNALTEAPGFVGAYRVTEALPVNYQKSWPDGETTPGACLLTLFCRKKGIGYDTFIHRWHNSHTPLSLKIHPLWNYSRNVVDGRLTGNSTLYEGIVEEQVISDRDLLNPFRFFGNPLVILPRMLAVYRDTKSFIDYGGIETYFAREIVLRSLAPGINMTRNA